VRRTPVAGNLPGFGHKICGLWLWTLLVCLTPFLSGCRKADEPRPDVVVEHEITPQPPTVGPATVTVTLSDAGGTPRNGAHLRLEATMSHAGMRPLFSDAREVGPGRYEAPIEFTMAGDWILLITISLPDGGKLQRQVDVKGVRPASARGNPA
jgi:hypothetical protein